MKINADVLVPENERIVREIGIPPCPQILMEIMREVRKEDTSLKRISHLISTDVGLSAAMVKTANSSFYGLRNKTTSVQGALSAVGLRCAANLIAGLMLRRAFASINHAAMVEFWDTTSKVSLTAAYLGRELGVASINDAHTFALFRDCGAPLLMQKFPDYWGTMRSAGMDDAQDMADMECANYGTHHASVGATLAMSWHLPAEIGQSIQMHHENRELSQSTNTPNDKPAILVSLGILADGIFRNYRDIPTSDHLDRESELAYKTLCVTHEDLDPLQSDIKRILSGE